MKDSRPGEEGQSPRAPKGSPCAPHGPCGAPRTRGGDDSVTQFFKRSSSDQLLVKFMPIVKEQTAKLKLADQYNKFAGKAASAGLVDKKNADIDTYVTHKAMDGLFLMIAEEEKKLRSNPMGAGSELLGKVFGAL